MSGNQPTRLEVRFGDEILDAGFTVVPNLILRHYAQLGLSPAEMMFTIHVWEFWWSEQEPYPSLATIAERMNMTRRNIRKYVQSLREKGYLIVNERFNANGQTTSEYDFSPFLQAVIDRSTPIGTDGPTSLGTNRPRGAEQMDRAPRNTGSSEEDEIKIDRLDEDRNRIERFISDFRVDLRDRASLSSSVTRAFNIYQRSHLDLSDFTDLMYEARLRTKGATNIRNRMSYFFSTLENLITEMDESNGVD